MIKKKDFYELANRVTRLEEEVFRLKNPYKYKLLDKVIFKIYSEPDLVRGGDKPCDKKLKGVILGFDISYSVFLNNEKAYNNIYNIAIYPNMLERFRVMEKNILGRSK